jgi:hypothetical protein
LAAGRRGSAVEQRSSVEAQHVTMTVKGAKALEMWCARATDGYPAVDVCNMSSAWRNGLAFCAIIHRFRPDLIDFAKLDKRDVRG